MASKLISNTLLLSTFAGLTVLAAPAQAADQPKYKTLQEPIASTTSGKTEVLEFFAYNCPHCFKVQESVEKLTKHLPDNVVFKAVPVAWNAGMEPMQHFYYTFQAIAHPELHTKLFKAIHEEHEKVFTKDAFIEWVSKQPGIDKKEVESAYDSFGVSTKVKQAAALTKQYQISGTPTFAVAGKYLTSPSQAGSYDGAVETVQELLDKVPKENGAGDKADSSAKGAENAKSDAKETE